MNLLEPFIVRGEGDPFIHPALFITVPVASISQEAPSLIVIQKPPEFMKVQFAPDTEVEVAVHVPKLVTTVGVRPRLFEQPLKSIGLPLVALAVATLPDAVSLVVALVHLTVLPLLSVNTKLLELADTAVP